ncbi:MAG: hypothetical protein NTNFB01_17550 [Nitrospira sp.]
MVNQICLAITVQVMRLQADWPANRMLEDTGRPRLWRPIFKAFRVAVLRKPHLDGSYQANDLLHVVRFRSRGRLPFG